MNDLTIDPKMRRLDLAARAAWLYYIKRRTQDEIAVELNVSRPNAQRLVALAISEGLIKFRLDHPLLHSIELGERIRDRFKLVFCDVAPSESQAGDGRIGVAHRAAELVENLSVAEGEPDARFRHRPDAARNRAARRFDESAGSQDRLGGRQSDAATAGPVPMTSSCACRTASARNAIRCRSPSWPTRRRRCDILKAQRGYRAIQSLFEQADALVLGVGSVDAEAPIYVDGFVNADELRELQRLGAAGELVSRSFDPDGDMIESSITSRLTAMRLTPAPQRPTILVASGVNKVRALHAALRGRFANGLITRRGNRDGFTSHCTVNCALHHRLVWRVCLTSPKKPSEHLL